MTTIEKQILSLGLKPGISIEIHCSLKKMETTIEPKKIIELLQKTITENGNIVMPSFPLSKTIELTDQDRIMGIQTKSKWLPENHNERTDNGLLSDTFRLCKNVKTGFGKHRMSVWGKNAKEICDDLGFLIDNNGYALLIGVDIRKLTSMHYVESGIPNDIWPLLFSKLNPDIEKNYDLNNWFITTELLPKYLKGWLYVQSIAEEKHLIIHGKIAHANCMFFNIKQVVTIYEDMINNHLEELFGLEIH